VVGLVASASLLAACGSDNTGSNPPAGSGSPSASGSGSAIDCPDGDLNWDGSSAQKQAVNAWIQAFQNKCSSVSINYAGNGSGGGRTSFIQKQIPVAGSDSHLNDEQQPQADARCAGGKAVNIPMVLTPVALIFNIKGVDKLTLTPAIIAKIFHGLALANASPVATVAYGYAAQPPYAYNPPRAKALLAEAGVTAAQPLTLELLHPAKHYGQAFDEATGAAVEMLKAVGVQVSVHTLDFGTLLQTLTKGTLPPNGGFAACRTSNNLDADDFVRDWASTTLVNWTPYPPELLSLYQATRRQVDTKKRLALLAELQAKVREWAPVVSLYQEKKAYAHTTRVLQFVPTPELNMDFRGVALKR